METQALLNNDKLVLNGHEFTSRFILGSGKYSLELIKAAVEQAGAGLEDDQREVFYRVLALIAGNLHTICKNGLKEGETT